MINVLDEISRPVLNSIFTADSKDAPWKGAPVGVYEPEPSIPYSDCHSIVSESRRRGSSVLLLSQRGSVGCADVPQAISDSNNEEIIAL